MVAKRQKPLTAKSPRLTLISRAVIDCGMKREVATASESPALLAAIKSCAKDVAAEKRALTKLETHLRKSYKGITTGEPSEVYATCEDCYAIGIYLDGNLVKDVLFRGALYFSDALAAEVVKAAELISNGNIPKTVRADAADPVPVAARKRSSSWDGNASSSDSSKRKKHYGNMR